MTPSHCHSLFSQVLQHKQVDNPEVKQVSVRRFATFNLFSRKGIVTQDPSDTSDDQWVEYRSVFFPEHSALLRYADLHLLTKGSCFIQAQIRVTLNHTEERSLMPQHQRT